MNRKLISHGALALCLLTAPLLASADHHMDGMHDEDTADQHMDGMHDEDTDGQEGGMRHHDPVQRAEKHLKDLEKKLNLKPDQQSAWNTYSDAMMQRAAEQAERMKAFQGKRDEMRNLDTASKLERMAEWMRERAVRLEQLAKETRTFQNSLSAKQQTTFDKYWEKHNRRGRGPRS